MKKKRSLKRSLMSLLAVTFPWVILLIDDNPGGAFVALVMQATGIGWIFASIWAWNIVHEADQKNTHLKGQDKA